MSAERVPDVFLRAARWLLRIANDDHGTRRDLREKLQEMRRRRARLGGGGQGHAGALDCPRGGGGGLW